jgi:hypothetical protein
MSARPFVEIGHCQSSKRGELAEGDVFMSRKAESDGRIILALSDGLGSGVKANVLATLTATMALNCVANDIPIRRTAGIIMKTLPFCSERKISYATFTIVDVDWAGSIRIIEYDNPPYVLVRRNELVEPVKFDITAVRSGRKVPQALKAVVMRYSSFEPLAGDRLVIFSDGVTQSGMGSRSHPLGWGTVKAHDFIRSVIDEEGGISARELARRVVREALSHDGYAAKDDITCGVVYFRNPRNLLVVTGPPVNPARDAELAALVRGHSGRSVVCGGTTANIVSRELGRRITVDLKHLDPEIPPAAFMEGIDLVTEGIITLSRVVELLEGEGLDNVQRSVRIGNPAARMVELLMDSDVIEFAVGTKINEAHQDPNIPVELDIRRNIIKRMASLLAEKYLKEVRVRYI